MPWMAFIRSPSWQQVVSQRFASPTAMIAMIVSLAVALEVS